MATTGLSSGGERRKRPKKFLCGTPHNECCGSAGALCNSLQKGGAKTHSSPQESFRCYRSYLLRSGYTQIGPREFTKGPTEPVLFLTKSSKFGSMLRGGKGNRYMPKDTIGISGTIVSI
jgi:hypothetical protein